MALDQPVDLEENPPEEPFAGQGGGAQIVQFPTLSRSLGRRSQDPRAMALQERRMADTEMIANRRFAVDAQKLELEKIRQLTELHKEESAIHKGFETQRQRQSAMKGLLGIKTGEDFETRILEIGAEHPEAMNDPFIKEHIDTRRKTRAEQQTYVSGLQHQADIRSRETGVDVPIDPVSGRPNFTAHSAMIQARDAAAAKTALEDPMGADTRRVVIGKDGRRVVTREQDLSKPIEEKVSEARALSAARAEGTASVKQPVEKRERIAADLDVLNKTVAARYGVSLGDITAGASKMQQVGAREGGKWDNKGPVTHVEFTVGDGKDFKRIPIADFAKIQEQIAAVDAPDKAAASAKAEDPRLALAKKALDDPTASEAHKAAAKKILGL